jgi:hypothetical protein
MISRMSSGSNVRWDFKRHEKEVTYFLTGNSIACEPGSSVNVVSGYGLDDRTIEVRSPAEAKEFFLYSLRPERLWGLFLGLKRCQSVTLTTNPLYCRGREWVGAIPLLPPSALVVCSGTTFIGILLTHKTRTAQVHGVGSACAVCIISGITLVVSLEHIGHEIAIYRGTGQLILNRLTEIVQKSVVHLWPVTSEGILCNRYRHVYIYSFRCSALVTTTF